ncbi:DUF3987 domain-containing protein [Photobacterium angustum]|uniref:DUF3987 domain-containing protein n=1 Tax=Photobacterium angustum TaxID=661 RepID=UPI0005E2390B|nr:DUF3987 domain-containing protein [Photobacterium angustum]KJG00123.1 hypothetical protein UB35_19940 [Photobacterium angustum]PSV61684.1 DUF3987 domain-containing protein [Photobacterium angustum]
MINDEFIQTINQIEPPAKKDAVRDFYKKVEGDKGEKGQLLEGKSHLLLTLARQVSRNAQFPNNTAFLSTLAVASSVVTQAYSVCYINGATTSCGLYVLTQQPSGANKSRVFSELTGPLLEAHGRHNKIVKKEIARIKAVPASDRTEEQKEKLASLRLFRPALSDVTPAAAEEIASSQGGILNFASDEQGLLLSLFSTTNGNESSKDLVLKGYNMGYNSSSRITRSGYDGHLNCSMLIIAQDGIFDAVMDASGESGLSERVICYSEPNMLGKRDARSLAGLTKIEEEEQRFQSWVSANYTAITQHCVDLNRKNNPTGKEGLRPLSLSMASWERIAKLKDEIEPLLADGGKYSHGTLRGYASKIDLQIMKMAAAFHVFDSANVNENGHVRNVHSVISGHAVDLAIELAEQLLENYYNELLDLGHVGVNAEFEAILNAFNNFPERTRAQITGGRRRVKPFKGMKSPSNVINDCIDRMVELELLEKTADGYKVATSKT